MPTEIAHQESSQVTRKTEVGTEFPQIVGKEIREMKESNRHKAKKEWAEKTE